MPNTRRRRFSVQSNIISNASGNKVQAGSQTSEQIVAGDPEIKQIAQNLISMKTNRLRNKISPISSRYNTPLEILAESESEISVTNVDKDLALDKANKEVSASSSNIDLFDLIKTENTPPSGIKGKDESFDKPSKHEARSNTVRRERYPRQHRIKVRSPKRRMSITNVPHKLANNVTIGITTNFTDEEIIDMININPMEVTERTSVDHVVQDSNNSLDDMCRICHGGEGLTSELGQMISACACRGTVGRVHVKCLEHWLTESGKSRCELCGTRYSTCRVHRYGVVKALLMWLLSQNTKQLMVDSLGIILMSPLAILAAWLSGKTLAGLMTQDNQITPWPLASTFVLACMTLVCYYCWIVSAVTRHALGWWIWYRSQYEVRLQLLEE